MRRVLIIHPREWRLQSIEDAFGNAGFDVYGAQDPESALVDLYTSMPDLVIVANDSPEKTALFQRIVHTSKIPVIAICFEGVEPSGPNILNEGADHYVYPPANPIELVARANSMLRRIDNFQKKRVLLNPERLEARIGEKTIRLTPTQFRLFAYLVANEGRFVEYPEILSAVWPGTPPPSMNTLHHHIRRLKLKLELGPNEQYKLREFRGKGCCFSKTPKKAS